MTDEHSIEMLLSIQSRMMDEMKNHRETAGQLSKTMHEQNVTLNTLAVELKHLNKTMNKLEHMEEHISNRMQSMRDEINREKSHIGSRLDALEDYKTKMTIWLTVAAGIFAFVARYGPIIFEVIRAGGGRSA